jgi:monomeric sarcosine oxidase
MDENYEIIVVGGGAVGLSAAYHASAAGTKVLVLEQYPFFHGRGSSGGASRMWRVLYSEMHLARLAVETSPMWDELSANVGQPLVDRSGILHFGVDADTREGSLELELRTMRELNLPHERLASSELQSRFPFRGLPSDYWGVFQPDAGTIDVRATMRGLFRLTKARGAVLHDKEKVLGIDSSAARVRVWTDRGEYSARKVIVCPGAFVHEALLPMGIKVRTKIWKMTYAHYQVLEPSATFPMWFHFAPTERTGEVRLFYGFPDVPWARPGYVKLAIDSDEHPYRSGYDHDFAPVAKDVGHVSEFVRQHMAHLDTAPQELCTCLAIHMPDGGFLLDHAPGFVKNNENVLVCTAGWAFKYVPIFGKILAELALTGKTKHDITHFAFTNERLEGQVAR